MDDEFFVRPERLRALSRTFSTRQGTPPELAGKLDGAATVDTGDPSVDGAIREDVTRVTAMLRQFGEALGQVSQRLDANAQTYEDGDREVGDALDAITGALGSTGGTDEPGPDLGIGDRLQVPTS